jgi:hypothetical protein
VRLAPPGSGHVYPADAALSLPASRHSHALVRLAVLEAARGSFETAHAAITRRCGPVIGKRQVEQAVVNAAGDIAAFYAARIPMPCTASMLLSSEFFDARDAVQVKYEMVRKVQAGGAPVTQAAAAFGYSRPAYYAAAAALQSSGLEGLVPARPGPRGGHKLTGQILAWAEEQLAADPGLRPAQLPDGSSRPSACACTPARSSEPWPAAGSATWPRGC